MNRYVTHVGSLDENMHRWKLARDWFFKESVQAKAMVHVTPRHLLPGGPGCVATPVLRPSPKRGNLVTAIVIEREPSNSTPELVQDFERRADGLTPRAVNDVSWPLVGTKLWTRKAAELYTETQTLCGQQRKRRDARDAPYIEPPIRKHIEITPPMKASDLSLGLVEARRKHRMPMKSQLIPEYHKSYLKDPNGTVYSGPSSVRGVTPMTRDAIAAEQLHARDTMERALLSTLPTLKQGLSQQKSLWTGHIANRAVVGRYHGVRPLRKLKGPAPLSGNSGASTPGSPANAYAPRNITRGLLMRGGSPC